jgi:hypothetical protein
MSKESDIVRDAFDGLLEIVPDDLREEAAQLFDQLRKAVANREDLILDKQSLELTEWLISQDFPLEIIPKRLH